MSYDIKSIPRDFSLYAGCSLLLPEHVKHCQLMYFKCYSYFLTEVVKLFK